MPDIFINYRTGDGEGFATLIERELSRRFGSDKVFRASKSIRPGEDYRHRLAADSAGARALLAVIGPDWLTATDASGNRKLDDPDDWTRRELLNAREHGARVIPVLCGRTVPRLSAAELPSALGWLADCQYLRFDTAVAESDLDRIARDLADLVPGLVEVTREPAESGDVRNVNHGQASGGLFQMRDQHGSISHTVINGGTGPTHTGPGPLYAGPSFHGGVNNYVAGRNNGGIHQNFGAQGQDEADD